MSKTANDTPQALKTGPLDVFKYRWVFLGISLAFLIPGIFFIISNIMNPDIQAPVRLGIDFKGGTLLEYGFSRPVTQTDTVQIRDLFDKHGYSGAVVQIQQPQVGINKEAVQVGSTETTSETSPATESTTSATTTPAPETATTVPAKSTAPEAAKTAETAKAPVVKPEAGATTETPATTAAPASTSGTGVASIVSIRSKHIQGHDDQAILKDLEAQYGPITLLQKVSMGPSLARELLVNGVLALVLAYILITGYLTFRFQFDFAVCAIVALLHDTLFLLGMFAMFGALFHTEVDSLFVTSVLTVVGFSVHDTIVVFDRIRENNRLYFTKKVPFVDIVNMSVNQTMARSINTSLTALLTMLALFFFGGETTRDFVLAIIIGIAAGTYSSIFNASVLLAMWRNKAQSTAAVAA